MSKDTQKKNKELREDIKALSNDVSVVKTRPKPRVFTAEERIRAGKAKIGTKAKKTLAKEAAWAAYENKMIQSMEELMKTQLIMAMGSIMIMKKVKEYAGKGKSRRVVRSHIEQVTADWEITEFMDKYINGDNSFDEESDFYFIQREKPDFGAIKDAYDRIFGKPTQTTKLMVSKSLSDLINEIDEEE